MKKTLVALAALAVVGAASAQSTVTLYGRIDASIQSVTTTAAGGAKTDNGLLVTSGGRTGSRWGLRGSEDLGGGLKANFQLEQGFSIDTGNASDATKQFNRQAWVGLSGGWGSVQAGRQYSPLDNAWGNYDPQGYTGYSAMGFAWNAGAHADAGRINNSLRYASPNWSGFSGEFMYAPGETDALPGNDAKYMSFGLNYAAGPLGIGYAYETTDVQGASSIDAWVLGGQYDFGMLKAYLAYQEAKNKTLAGTPKDSGWLIGVAVPIGSMTLNVGYAAEDTTTNGVKTADNESFAIELSYPLSKRTYVYGAYRDGKNSVPGTKEQKYGMGLVHNF